MAHAPDKKRTLLGYLSRGVAMVHLDARRGGVVVPPQYAQDAHLRLNFSYRYAIADLDISDEHVQATLSFGGRPFQCVLPWDSIFGITCQASGDGQVWPEDLPSEVKESADRRRREGPVRPAAQPRAPLSAVPGGSEGRPQAESAKGAEGRPHLRLVR
jgi:stringent starvation protein B